MNENLLPVPAGQPVRPDRELEGIPIPPPDRPAETDMTLGTLEALAGIWEDDAEKRRLGAERSMPLGPRQMILAAEGSVMLACAGQLREALRITRGRQRPLPITGRPRRDG